MTTQPNVMVSLLIALCIHVVIACILLWKNSVEKMQYAEISQGMEIKLDSHAYQSILHKEQEKKEKKQEIKKAVEKVKPKKEIVKKIKKIKAVPQKVVSEMPKEKAATYQVKEKIKKKIAPTETVKEVAEDTNKVATVTKKPTQIAQTNVREKKIKGKNGITDQKPLEMNDSTKRYIAKLMRHLQRYKQYPALLKKNHIEGKPVIRFSINKSGHLTNIEVKKHAKNAELDQAAMEVFRRASPLPKIPSALERETLTMSLPIEYSLIND